MNEFRKRRSIRKYKDKPIEKEVINTILENVLISPSSRDRKPWEFIVVTEKNILSELSQARQRGSDFLKDVPAAIVVISETEKSDVWIEDLSVAAYTIQLSAFEAGLGSCWIQIRNRKKSDHETSEDFIKATLDIPDNYEIECIIVIGYSDEEKGVHTKEEMEFSKIHYNKF